MATAPDIDLAVAERLWRRQTLLVVLTAALVGVALVLVAVMGRDGGVRGDTAERLTWAVAAAAAAAVPLFVACVAHAARVAVFTFRKEI